MDLGDWRRAGGGASGQGGFKIGAEPRFYASGDGAGKLSRKGWSGGEVSERGGEG